MKKRKKIIDDVISYNKDVVDDTKVNVFNILTIFPEKPSIRKLNIIDSYKFVKLKQNLKQGNDLNLIKK